MADKQKTVHRFLNAADVIVVLALLAILCGIFFRRPLETIISDRFNSVTVTYTLCVYDVPADQADFLRENDRIYNSDGQMIGQVETVQTELSSKNPSEGSGAERVNVLCRVLAEGLSDSSGVYVGEDTPMFIAPGKTVEAHSSDYTSFTGVVRKVEIVG